MSGRHFHQTFDACWQRQPRASQAGLMAVRFSGFTFFQSSSRRVASVGVNQEVFLVCAPTMYEADIHRKKHTCRGAFDATFSRINDDKKLYFIKKVEGIAAGCSSRVILGVFFFRNFSRDSFERTFSRSSFSNFCWIFLD